MSDHKTTQELRRSEIQKICEGKFLSLREISEILKANKNTIRSRYLYPMAREGILIQEHPPGTKSIQRYKTAV
jgi:hypothetical protein